MLKFLSIANIAVIRKLEVEFENGLNLLTGETGSGKSIIIDSLNLLLGNRATSDMIRTGEETASVEALFLVSKESPIRSILREAGIGCEEEELILRREISSSGRNKIFINNSLATVGTLREIGTHLVDIHGQHDHQSLLNPQYHLEMLDRFGGNQAAVGEIADLYDQIRTLDEKLKSLQIDEQQRLRQIDILSSQANEIERAQLSLGEDQELLAERNILLNMEKLFSLASESFGILYEDEKAVLTNLKKLLKNVDELSRIDARFQPYTAQVENVSYQLDDLAFFLRDYTGTITFSRDRVDHVESRLAEVDKLKKKYGPGLDDVLAYLTKIKEELDGLSRRNEQEERLKQELGLASNQYLSQASVLSKERRNQAEKLQKEMREELKQLAMEATNFKVELNPQAVKREEMLPKITRRGIDEVEFFAATNKGEALKPLVKIASGGELSRIILALKTIIAADAREKTLIFDEVDSGIGGRVAEVVGRKLKRVSKNNQVICITHWPQIASFADGHYFVSKAVRERRTEVSIEKLMDKGRVEEVARMLGGEQITETTTKHAKEMLKLSESGRSR